MQILENVTFIRHQFRRYVRRSLAGPPVTPGRTDPPDNLRFPPPVLDVRPRALIGPVPPRPVVPTDVPIVHPGPDVRPPRSAYAEDTLFAPCSLVRARRTTPLSGPVARPLGTSDAACTGGGRRRRRGRRPTGTTAEEETPSRDGRADHGRESSGEWSRRPTSFVILGFRALLSPRPFDVPSRPGPDHPGPRPSALPSSL